MLDKLKKLIIPIIVIVAIFFGYTIFFKDGGGDVDLNSNQSPEDILGNEIITTLNRVNSINLNTGIFDSPVYRSLVDRSQEIPDEPLGRNNPFAPIR